MIVLLRNSAAVLVVTILLAANIYWQVLNPYVACFAALAAGWMVGIFIEKFFIGRAHEEMQRSYGKEWGI
jgi:ABC-type transporter Mla maintaining outer membrane lipid asymmetry permease subunit MlaE